MKERFKRKRRRTYLRMKNLINKPAYVVLFSKKDNKIIWYVQKVLMLTHYAGGLGGNECYFCSYNTKNDNNEIIEVIRSYRPHRLFDKYTDARKMADFKNKSKILKNAYDEFINQLKETILEE